jgi:hypothetical protein
MERHETKPVSVMSDIIRAKDLKSGAEALPVDVLNKAMSESKAFPHPGEDLKFTVYNQTEVSYTIENATMTLVRAYDAAGILRAYATMTWSPVSHNRWTTYYSNNPPPNISILFISINNGTIGYPFLWNLGGVHLECNPAKPPFYRTDIDPNIYDIVLNWTFDSVQPVEFYKVCQS